MVVMASSTSNASAMMTRRHMLHVDTRQFQSGKRWRVSEMERIIKPGRTPRLMKLTTRMIAIARSATS